MMKCTSHLMFVRSKTIPLVIESVTLSWAQGPLIGKAKLHLGHRKAGLAVIATAPDMYNLTPDAKTGMCPYAKASGRDGMGK